MALQLLPLGYQEFTNIRRENRVYVDKTAYLLDMIDNSPRCFLARPRRFGKSLTLSTLAAMFQGKAEFFGGLAAESFVIAQSKSPAPVIWIDMACKPSDDGLAGLKDALADELFSLADDWDISLSARTLEGQFAELIKKLYNRQGHVAVLIDEYDKPILSWLQDAAKAEEMRRALYSFYSVLKSSDKYLRFMMLTGVSKFSKLGIFSGLNNLDDISMNEKYGALCGYTQEELEFYFSERLDAMAQELNMERQELLSEMKDYCGGFCFDGLHRVYGPCSVLKSLDAMDLNNDLCESVAMVVDDEKRAIAQWQAF